MLKGIETVVYFVEDVKRACAWYREVLGVAPNHDTEHYAGFTVAGDELGLHPGAPVTGGPTAYWSVADLDAAVAHFVAHGATVSTAAQDVGGGIKVGTVRDPFGNDVGLIENPRSPNR
jgi:predicted enzyme related to lactoylglutathione lyase